MITRFVVIDKVSRTIYVGYLPWITLYPLSVLMESEIASSHGRGRVGEEETCARRMLRQCL